MMGRFSMLRTSRKDTASTNAMLSVLAGTLTLMLVLLAARTRRKADRLRVARNGPAPDYSGRSGWPEPVEQMRGRARGTFEIRRDMRQPQAWG